MAKIFYLYRPTTDRNWNEYTPAYTLKNSYPEFDITFNDWKIITNIVTWTRLGWVDCKDEQKEAVEAELIETWPSTVLILKFITDADALSYIRDLTDYTEVEPNKFELSNWVDETGISWEPIYLTI